jgi:hypothetical protein
MLGTLPLRCAREWLAAGVEDKEAPSGTSRGEGRGSNTGVWREGVQDEDSAPVSGSGAEDGDTTPRVGWGRGRGSSAGAAGHRG